MGDYVKLIVNAEAKVSEEDLKKQLKELRLGGSAYHCDGVVEHFNKNSYREEILNIVLVGQTKDGRRQDEFLQWLGPYVIDGNGPADVWAIQFSEYSEEPVLWRTGNPKE